MPHGKYRIIAFGQQLGIGVAGSQYVSVSAVAKCNSPAALYCIPNELICAEIGRFLCLPIPPAGIVHAPQAAAPDWFASFDFNLTGTALPPVDPSRCATELPDLATGVLLFDMLVANCDRHRGNLSVDFTSQPPEMNIFDHSHALFGFAGGQGRQRLVDLRERMGVSGGSHTRGNRHCLLDMLTTDAYFGKWLDRVSRLPDFLIQEVCGQAIGLGVTVEESQGAVDFVRYRRDNLKSIIDDNRREFRGIQQWSLFA
jgi:hypothetical protein